MSEVRRELSAIVLCYRAGESVKRVVAPLYNELIESGLRIELVLVANSEEAHPDPTAPIVQDLASRHEHVRAFAGPKEGCAGMGHSYGIRGGRRRHHGGDQLDGTCPGT